MRRSSVNCLCRFGLLVGIGAVFLAAAGCRLSGSNPTTTVASTPTQDTALFPGTYAGSIVTSDGRIRTFDIHIPTGYSPEKTYPLVLLFHGGNGTGEKILQQTDFAAEADSQGFIVVAPDGIDKSWADGRGTTAAERSGVDDVSFVRQLISHLESQYPIDPTRIYATGASNGGMMVERLGCELSGELAAIAPDVGPMPTNIAPTCKPSPIPVLGIQGSADPLVPIGGGSIGHPLLTAGGLVQSAAQTMQQWASIDGCNATPSVTSFPPKVDDGTSVDEYVYSDCTGSTAVDYYIVQGMGHAWPPNPPLVELFSGSTSQNLNATDVIWNFFTQHHL